MFVGSGGGGELGIFLNLSAAATDDGGSGTGSLAQMLKT